MTSRRPSALAAWCVPLALALVPHAAEAGPLNPWTGVTSAGHIAITPYLYVYEDGTANPIFFGWYGIEDRADVMVGAGVNFDPSGEERSITAAPIQAMVRFFPHENVGLALHAFYTPGEETALLGPELHAFYNGGRFSFAFNTGWYPVVQAGGAFDPGTWFAIVAPEVWVSDWFSLFVELDPTVPLAEPEFGLTVVPGLSFYLDKDQNHGMAAGVQLAVAPEWSGASVGLTYFAAFDVRKKSARTAKAAAERPALAAGAALAPAASTTP